MTVVTPPGTATPLSDPATVARSTGDPAATAAPDDAAPFDQVLSRQIDSARKGAVEPIDARSADPRFARARMPGAHEPTTPDTPDTGTLPVVAGSGEKKLAVPDALHAADDDGSKSNDAPTGLAQDLASQLALVAQWAGIAKPAAADETTPTAATEVIPDRKGLDIQVKLDTVRGTTPHETGSADPLAADAATPPSAPLPQGAGKPASPPVLAASLDSASKSNATTTPDAAILLTPVNSAITATVAAAHANAAPAPIVAAAPDRLHEQVGTPAWSHEVGQAALRIAAGDLQSASLRLNPEHLGPLDVQVRIDDGVAHVAFQAAHADTRQALDASRTTLEQMFQNQGLKTGDVSIASQTRDPSDLPRFGTNGGQANTSTGRGSSGRGNADTGGTDDGSSATTSVRLVRALGLVDTFA